MFLTSKSQKYLPFFIWVVAALFYGYENFLQVSLNVIGPDIVHEFRLSAVELGILASFYFYTYSIMQIPVGILLDRYGARVNLTCAVLIVALGSLCFGLADGFSVAALSRLLIGLGSAFAIVSALKLTANWFPFDRFAFLSGLTVTIGFSGSIFGEYPLAVLVDQLGWRANMLIFSAIGLVLTLLIVYIVRNAPETSLKNSNVASFDLRKNLKQIAAKPANWLVAFYGCLMYAPTVLLGSAWGGMFMMSAYHVPRSTAVGIISFLYFGWIVGAPLFGFGSDYWRRRKPILLIASLGATLSLTPVLFLNTIPLWFASVLLFLFGFFTSGFFIAFSVIRELNSPTMIGTVMGYMNTMNSLGGVIAPYVVGLLLDWHWQGMMRQGVRQYMASDFHVALSILPLMMLSAFLIAYFKIPETYCQHQTKDFQT